MKGIFGKKQGLSFFLSSDRRRQEIEMGMIAANLAFEGHILRDVEITCSPELAPYIEMVRKLAYELAVFGQFGIQAHWLTVADIAALRQLPKDYPEGESRLVATAIETFLRAQLSNLYCCVQRCEIF
jgi:hypothetical protein